jgi:hypothetical protein
MLQTGEYSLEDEEDYTEKNVRATYAEAKFARIRSIPQKQLQQVIEPIPPRSMVGHPFSSVFNQYSDRFDA